MKWELPFIIDPTGRKWSTLIMAAITTKPGEPVMVHVGLWPFYLSLRLPWPTDPHDLSRTAGTRACSAGKVPAGSD